VQLVELATEAKVPAAHGTQVNEEKAPAIVE
jgi:hypothetical protein